MILPDRKKYRKSEKFHLLRSTITTVKHIRLHAETIGMSRKSSQQWTSRFQMKICPHNDFLGSFSMENWTHPGKNKRVYKKDNIYLEFLHV